MTEDSIGRSRLAEELLPLPLNPLATMSYLLSFCNLPSSLCNEHLFWGCKESINFFFSLRFIYFREHVSEHEGKGGAEGDGKRTQADSVLSSETLCGTQSHNPKIMTELEMKSQTLNQLSCPGVPLPFISSYHCLQVNSPSHMVGYIYWSK